MESFQSEVMKRKELIYIIITFALLGSYYIYSKPVTIERTYSGIVYSIDSNVEEEVQLSLTGEVYRYLFANDRIVGKIKIDDRINAELDMKRSNDNFSEIKFSTDQLTGNVTTMGDITISEDFKLVSLHLDEIDKIYNRKCYVSAPAKDAEEGNMVKKKLMKKKKE